MSDQDKQVFLASGNLMSLSQAAELTPYSSEYLSLRARTGHLRAVKVGYSWLTTKEAVQQYLRKQRAKHQGMAESLRRAEEMVS